MAVAKNPKITAVQVPIHNINQFIRVPGMPPTPLAQAMQTWDKVEFQTSTESEPETPNEKRTCYWAYFGTGEGIFRLPLTEQLYEVGLYTRATKRFGDWMRDNKDKPGVMSFA